LIYNFPIYHLDHFSSKILRKSELNRASPKNFAPGTRAHATSNRNVASTHCRPPYTPAEVGLGPPVRAPWDTLAPHHLPSPLPLRHALRAPWPGRADHATSRPLDLPSYTTAHRCRTARPCRDFGISLACANRLPIRTYIRGRSSPATHVALLPRAARRRHGRRRRAPVPACVPSCPAFQAAPLGPAVAPQAACCSGRAATRRSNRLQRPPALFLPRVST
jgi:hypothetical protein